MGDAPDRLLIYRKVAGTPHVFPLPPRNAAKRENRKGSVPRYNCLRDCTVKNAVAVPARFRPYDSCDVDEP